MMFTSVVHCATSPSAGLVYDLFETLFVTHFDLDLSHICDVFGHMLAYHYDHCHLSSSAATATSQLSSNHQLYLSASASAYKIFPLALVSLPCCLVCKYMWVWFTHQSPASQYAVQCWPFHSSSFTSLLVISDVCDKDREATASYRNWQCNVTDCFD